LRTKSAIPLTKVDLETQHLSSRFLRRICESVARCRRKHPHKLPVFLISAAGMYPAMEI
jgi:hypothetical protein